jgi:hypothetical protein
MNVNALEFCSNFHFMATQKMSLELTPLDDFSRMFQPAIAQAMSSPSK